MNILFIIPTLGQGGAQRVLVNLANSLAVSAPCLSRQGSIESDRYNISIVTFASSDVAPHNVPSHRIPVHYLGAIAGSRSSGIGLVGSILKLRNIVQEVQPHVVVAFQDIAIYPAILSCIGCRAKLIISERQDTRFYRLAFVRRLLRWVMYRFANRVVVQTELVKKQMPGHAISRTTVIPNASPVLSMRATPSRAQACTYKIISVGRLELQKNFSLLVEAAGLAFKGRDDWKLVIYGEGSLRFLLEQQIAELQLENKVELAGLTPSVFTKLAEANIFVFPSLYEGFPNVLAEATCIGLPCIAYKDVSGVQELIENDVNGLLLSSSERHALPLAAAMESLMDAPEKRVRMGKEGIRLASRYHEDLIIGSWGNLLHALVGEPG